MATSAESRSKFEAGNGDFVLHTSEKFSCVTKTPKQAKKILCRDNLLYVLVNTEEVVCVYILLIFSWSLYWKDEHPSPSNILLFKMSENV